MNLVLLKGSVFLHDCLVGRVVTAVLLGQWNWVYWVTMELGKENLKHFFRLYDNCDCKGVGGTIIPTLSRRLGDRS